MKRTFLALTFAAATMPFGFAQTPSTTTTEHTQDHSATQVNPDGSSTQHSSRTHEKTDAKANGDGTASTTTHNKSTHSRTKTKNSTDANGSTTEHHSTTSETTNTSPAPQQ